MSDHVTHTLDVLCAYFGDAEGNPHALNAIQIAVYGDALGEFSPSALEAGARKWMRSNRWFPKASELLECVKSCASEQRTVDAVKRLTANADAPTDVRCLICDDSGWETLQCPGTGYCGRGQKGGWKADPAHPDRTVYVGACTYPHSFVRKCRSTAHA